MISSIVIKVVRKDGKVVTYIDNKNPKSELRAKQHKCRIKEVIYGGAFGYYCEGMDFNISLQVGSTIVIDRREELGYTILGS